MNSSSSTQVRRSPLFGRSLLHSAIVEGYTELCMTLINEDGIDLNPQDIHGETPLHYAIQRFKTSIALELIKNGADVNVQNSRGETPLEMSIEESHNILRVAFLLQDYAVMDAILKNEQIASAYKPDSTDEIERAIHRRYKHLVKRDLEKLATLERLHENREHSIQVAGYMPYLQSKKTIFIDNVLDLYSDVAVGREKNAASGMD